MNQAHRWREHIPQDMLDSPVVGHVYEFPVQSIVSWVSPTTTPSQPVEKWVSQLDKVVQQFAEALARKHRSMETRVAALEKELGSLKAQFRLEEEFDKALAAEIDAIGDGPKEEATPDLHDLLPSGEELKRLLEEYDR